MGSPRELDESVAEEAPICIDLRRFVERSNGIFGRSGTGKSVLARLLLCGMIKSESSVNLIFDMHSEYATEKELEPRGAGKYAKGLRDPGKSRVPYTHGEEDSASVAGGRTIASRSTAKLEEIERWLRVKIGTTRMRIRRGSVPKFARVDRAPQGDVGPRLESTHADRGQSRLGGGPQRRLET